MDATAWLGWIAGPALGAGGAVLLFYRQWRTMKTELKKGDVGVKAEELKVTKDERDDTETRWKRLYDQLVGKMELLEKTVTTLQERDTASQVAIARLTVHNEYLQSEIISLKLRGGGAASECFRTEVTSDENGVIVDVSDGMMALLGWRPAELIGKPVETLLPERERADHAKVVLFAKGGKTRSPNTAIKGMALHKDGREIAVVVALDTLCPEEVGSCPTAKFRVQIMNLVV